jgi:hypothetical protein
MIKNLFFQLGTIWIYLMFCLGLLWCKILNMFFNMEWAIKLLYLGMNLICENIVKFEENWMNKLICSKTCGKSYEDDNLDDDTESFEDFIKKIKSENNQNNPNVNSFQNFVLNNNIPSQHLGHMQQGNGMQQPQGQPVPANVNFNSAQISTLNFPNPNSNIQNLNNTQTSIYSQVEDVDHDKIKKLIDRMYMKSVIQENEEDDNSPKTSIFSRKSQSNENKQIIFSRGIKEVDINIPEPNF